VAARCQHFGARRAVAHEGRAGDLVGKDRQELRGRGARDGSGSHGGGAAVGASLQWERDDGEGEDTATARAPRRRFDGRHEAVATVSRSWPRRARRGGVATGRRAGSRRPSFPRRVLGGEAASPSWSADAVSPPPPPRRRPIGPASHRSVAADHDVYIGCSAVLSVGAGEPGGKAVGRDVARSDLHPVGRWRSRRRHSGRRPHDVEPPPTWWRRRPRRDAATRGRPPRPASRFGRFGRSCRCPGRGGARMQALPDAGSPRDRSCRVGAGGEDIAGRYGRVCRPPKVPAGEGARPGVKGAPRQRSGAGLA